MKFTVKPEHWQKAREILGNRGISQYSCGIEKLNWADNCPLSIALKEAYPQFEVVAYNGYEMRFYEDSVKSVRLCKHVSQNGRDIASAFDANEEMPPGLPIEVELT